jgi:hypothetical protein
MYVNGKMRPVEIIPRISGRWIKKNSGRDKLNSDIFDIL